MDYEEFEHSTEEKVKRWWDENGKGLIGAVVVGIAAVFGWDQYQKNDLAQSEAVSAQFQNLLEERLALPYDASEEERSEVFELAKNLRADHAGSSYAVYADMMMAKLAVESKDFALAESHLKQAFQDAPTSELKQLANLRLAQVLYAQNKDDDALALLPADQEGAYGARGLELRADILLAKGDKAEARSTYENAIAQAGMSGLPVDVLELKRNDLNEVVTAETIN
ncbi:YfgM family protein [Litoribacillus peritrichatus]|uniref:Ancillary SecYEG translocon subunit n=1 Tax=Litoribacillus peritrichatus TaxID=718191 RepID=A0ABP7M3V2_9GAMM